MLYLIVLLYAIVTCNRIPST